MKLFKDFAFYGFVFFGTIAVLLLIVCATGVFVTLDTSTFNPLNWEGSSRAVFSACAILCSAAICLLTFISREDY